MGGDIWVDRGVEHLIEAFWAHGVETQYSCQGEPTRRWRPRFSDRGYVLFWHDEISDHLLAYTLARHEGFRQGYSYDWPDDSETYSVYPSNLRRFPYGVERDYFGEPKRLRVCLRFPHEAIHELTTFLEQAPRL